MKTFIIIHNSDRVITSPGVCIVRDGHYTGTSTSLGFDKSEARALEVAQEYAACYTDPEIVNLYNPGEWDSKMQEAAKGTGFTSFLVIRDDCLVVTIARRPGDVALQHCGGLNGLYTGPLF